MKILEVPLTLGMTALVDAEDYEAVMAAGSWHASPSHRTTYYARRGVYLPNPDNRGRGRMSTERMHNFLTGWARVDHVNGNGLDNRRANLRPATHGQNAKNRPRYSNNTSGFKGVHRRPDRSQWEAYIYADKRRHSLGRHATAVGAARAYDAAAIELHGAFARLNFPGEGRDVPQG